MERSLNRVLLIGRLGSSPEMRYTPQGEPVTAFRLATVRSWTTADGDRHQAEDWFYVIAWHDLAEHCHDALQHGAWVYVEGRLQTRSWQDEAGRSHNQTEIVATDVLPLEALAPGSPAGGAPGPTDAGGTFRLDPRGRS